MESSEKVSTDRRSDRKRERNKRRRGNIRKKRKEKVRQTYTVLKELEDKKEALAQARCQLAVTRKRALELTKGTCKPPTKCVAAQNNSRQNSVSSLRCFLRSKPTASSRLRSSTGVTHHSPDTIQHYQAINKIDRYSLISLGPGTHLGSGSFGKCTKMLLSATEVAVKTITLDSYSAKDILYEAEVMAEVCCGYPNLPLFIGIYDHPECPKPLLVTKFYSIAGEACTFHQYLRNQRQSDSQITVRDWARILAGICHGVQAIHKKGFLHNDLKCDNVVMSDCVYHSENNSPVWPIIIDFGKARSMTYPKKYKLSDKDKEYYLKNYTHLAPELVKGVQAQSVQTDIYSLGHIFKKVVIVTKSHDLKVVARLCTKLDFAMRPSLQYVCESLSDLVR